MGIRFQELAMRLLSTAVLGGICFFLSSIPGTSSWADAPTVLTYQGRLKESGLPVTGVRTVEIHLCTALTGGACSSSGAQNVGVQNGLFRSTFTLPGAVDLNGGEWFLRVDVGGAELSPREKLASVAYSLHATSATYLTGSVVASSANFTVTGDVGLRVSSGALLATGGGNVAIGTTTMDARLRVDGSVKIVDGTQGADKVLTSDAGGLAQWKSASGVKVATASASVGDSHAACCNNNVDHDFPKTVGFAARVVQCHMSATANSPNNSSFANEGLVTFFSDGGGYSFQSGAMNFYPSDQNWPSGCSRSTTDSFMRASCSEAGQGIATQVSIVNFTSTGFTIRINHTTGSSAWGGSASGSATCVAWGE